MRTTRLRRMPEAERDLVELRRRIEDAATTDARRYIRRLKKRVDKLKLFPESGWVVEELATLDIHEIVFDRYRILHRYNGRLVAILRVWPAARPLDLRRFQSE